MDLQLEAEQWMKEKKMSTITAALYQEKACETAIFPKNKAMEYLTLGLTGEAGEIANKVKKFIRDGAAKDEYLAKRIEIGYEIGDVLWYCAVLAEELDMSLVPLFFLLQKVFPCNILPYSFLLCLLSHLLLDNRKHR